MNCSTAQQHLSAFHDGELSPELALSLRDHCQDCIECARRLSELEKLSRFAAGLSMPEISSELWSKIEQELHSKSPQESDIGILNSVSRKRSTAAMFVAALLLVGVSLGIVIWQLPLSGHTHVGVNFGRYLDSLDSNPNGAEQVLLTNYHGEPVSFDEATRRLRYQPVAPPTLPDGKVREAIYLLKMPCCTCSQAIYKDSQGVTVSIFEHSDDQPVWFGDRPAIQTQCNGTSTQLIQIGDYLVASWRRQGRTLTVVGLRDIEQVGNLVAQVPAK